MSRTLTICRAGPRMTVQDTGRTGYLDSGLSRGGAADRLALAEGAALLGQPGDCAALEMAGMGGEFEVSEDMRIALTGAPMQASIDSNRIAWNASHLLPAGARLSIGSARSGVYGYLHLGGGIDTPPCLNARSAHLAGGLGQPLSDDDRLPVGEDGKGETGLQLEPEDRFGGGMVHIVATVHTGLFPDELIERLGKSEFRRDAHGNRMGVRLTCDGEGYLVEGGRTVVSEVIVPGDIQITGDGSPFVLLCECQTTGGYPRIGTVLPCDLPRVAQAPPGATLRFRFVDLEEAVEMERTAARARTALPDRCKPLIRDPHTIPDLLSYQLISGAVAGDELLL